MAGSSGAERNVNVLIHSGESRLASRVQLLVLGALMALGAGLRFARLGDWPPFVDEDMYSTVAAEMTHLGWPEFVLHSTDASSTGIAKTPLLFVGQAGLIDLGFDPVVAGRVLSALCGVVAIPLVYALGRRIATADLSQEVGLTAAALYAALPVAVFHERLVLQDGPMSTALLAAVVLAFLAKARASVGIYVVVALLAALAVQAKVSAVFGVIILLRIAFIGFAQSSWRHRLASLLPAGGIAVSYLALMLAPTGRGLSAQNAILAGATPDAMVANVATLADGLATYAPFGLWLLVPVGYVLLARRAPQNAMLVLWALIALIAPWLLLSRGSPMRYYLAAVPYICVLLAVALVLGSRWLAALRVRVPRAHVALPSAATLLLLGCSIRLVADPAAAQLSAMDDWAYRSGWPSGVMYANARRFIDAARLRGASSVAYIVDDEHRMAMGLYQRSGAGISIDEPLLLDPAIAPILSEAQLVVVDDTRYDDAPGQRLANLLELAPDLNVVARFADPGSSAAVTVLTHASGRPREANASLDS